MSSALGKSVCSQVCAWNFYPSNTAGQDVVREFSRGNAFNKNLMGSGSSAEPPYEFQVFGPWPAQEPSHRLQMALSAGWGQGPWSKDPPPQAPALLGRGGMLLQDGERTASRTGSGELRES